MLKSKVKMLIYLVGLGCSSLFLAGIAQASDKTVTFEITRGAKITPEHFKVNYRYIFSDGAEGELRSQKADEGILFDKSKDDVAEVKIISVEDFRGNKLAGAFGDKCSVNVSKPITANIKLAITADAPVNHVACFITKQQ